MVLSKDGEHLISCGENFICLRQFQTLEILQRFEIARNWSITYICFSTDEKYLWVISENSEVENCKVMLFGIDKPFLEI
jgi:hypothetical protein